MKTLDLNDIGELTNYEFAHNVYLDGDTLAVCIDCYAEAGFEDSCAAMEREAIIEIDGVYYCGEVAGIAYDYQTGELDVLLKLFKPGVWADE